MIKAGKFHFNCVIIIFSRTPELTDAGGKWHWNWKLTRPARVRSSDFVRPLVFHLESFISVLGSESRNVASSSVSST